MGAAERSQAAILEVVRQIPTGAVATYGQVAELAGLPGRARLVGRIMALLPPGSEIPWYRVLNASGAISLPPGGGLERQRDALRREGVEVSAAGRVSLRRHRWLPGSLD
jgi:methylated-DNA-protein-cysteine methyltransferase-like protein